MKTLFSKPLSESLLSSGLVITSLVLHLLSLVYQPYLNHDAAQYLSIGQMIVNGVTPYSGIIDVNPPMIFYLSSLPVILSRATNISLPIVSLFFFFAIMLLCGYLLIRTLEIEANHTISPPEKNLVWTFWIFLSFFTYKTDHFAQREQLIFMFLAAFIVLRKARYDAKQPPRRLAIICGLLAAIAFSMKPQFILAISVAELMFFVATHDRRNVYLVPEIIVLVLFGTIYIVHFFIVPGALSYFTYWIPMISRGYSAYDATWDVMFAALFADNLTYINLGILVLALVLLIRKQYKAQIGLFFAFAGYSLVSLMLYFIQFKGWLYQTLGFHDGGLTALVFLIREYGRVSSKIRDLSFVILIIMNLCGCSITLFDKDMKTRAPFQFPENGTAKVIKQLVPIDDRVLFLSTVVGASFPQMTYTERLGASRFLTAFPIAFFTDRSPQGEISPGWETDEQLYYSWLLQDILGQKPVLLLIDLSIEGQTYAYLSKRHFFDFILNYQCIGQSEELVAYLRVDESRDLNVRVNDKVEALYQQRILRKTPYCDKED